MGTSTFNGPVRSEGGFAEVSKNATTGVFTNKRTTTTTTDSLTAGTGITTGTGTLYYADTVKTEMANSTWFYTRIFMDITGLNCGGTAADIIGVNSTANCHIGQYTTAVMGTLYAGAITCLEAPTTGDPDIDVYSADEATGTEDAAISGLTNSTQLVNTGDLTLPSTDTFTAMPAADQYLYLVCGTATAGTYDAGQILLELWGRS